MFDCQNFSLFVLTFKWRQCLGASEGGCYSLLQLSREQSCVVLSLGLNLVTFQGMSCQCRGVNYI